MKKRMDDLAAALVVFAVVVMVLCAGVLFRGALTNSESSQEHTPEPSEAPTVYIPVTPAAEPVVVQDPAPAELDETPEPVPEPSGPVYVPCPDVPLDDDLQIVAQEVCDRYDVPYCLLLAVMETESRFTVDAVSSNGRCHGLMQISEVNFPWLMDEGIDAGEPAGNIEAGAFMLGRHYRAHDDWNKALMAYNCGTAGAQSLWEQGITSTTYSRYAIARSGVWQQIIDHYFDKEETE